jgi:hypothetical protein
MSWTIGASDRAAVRGAEPLFAPAAIECCTGVRADWPVGCPFAAVGVSFIARDCGDALPARCVAAVLPPAGGVVRLPKRDEGSSC